MPLPEFYDDFDPEEHDLESERLDALVHQHWLDDLRNLQSEADAERADMMRDDTSDYSVLRETFKALDPEPDRTQFQEYAEWEWRWLEFMYTQRGNERCLARHHLERGSFIERHATILRNAQEWADAFFAPLKEAARKRPKEHVPIPWPEGDGYSYWRRRLDEVSDPDPYEDAARQEPSYDNCANLRAALLGWHQSLEKEDYDAARPLHSTASNCVSKIQISFREDYSPGNIGNSLLSMRQGLEHTQDALDLLDACRGYTWLTPPAYKCLRSLLEDVRDSALDRYVELRAIYDGYLERALRILGGTKWTPPAKDDRLEEEL